MYLDCSASTALLRSFKSPSSPLRRRRSRFSAVANKDPNNQQLNLSVLRFTLGIPGLDESYLPRFMGIACGSFVLLNHFLSPSPTPAQLRSEALGLCLAAFSTALPYLGKFLKGANTVDRSPIPEGNKQMFIMSENLSVTREDLAWASYALLRNTNTISVLIAVHGALCVRGYWNTPEDVSKSQQLEWFESRIRQLGLLDIQEELYFPRNIDPQLRGLLPEGALSLLVQPVVGSVTDALAQVEGFILLASSTNYAYSDSDRAWIRAIANKFRAMSYSVVFFEGLWLTIDTDLTPMLMKPIDEKHLRLRFKTIPKVELTNSVE